MVANRRRGARGEASGSVSKKGRPRYEREDQEAVFLGISPHQGLSFWTNSLQAWNSCAAGFRGFS